MSKMRLTIQAAISGSLAILLLILQPFACVLHLECDHAAESHAPSAGHHCCDLHAVRCCSSHSSCTVSERVASTPAEDGESGHSLPVRSAPEPHDSQTCQICQTVFAARISLPRIECPAAEWIALSLPEPSVPTVSLNEPYRLRSRGPPL